MPLQPGKQFLIMLLMMVIRSHENEGETIAFQPGVSVPVQHVFFWDQPPKPELGDLSQVISQAGKTSESIVVYYLPFTYQIEPGAL